MFEKGFKLFGLTDILEVWISDNSSAADKLAALYSSKRHVLCFQHFRQHLSDAIASFSHAERRHFWSNIMKIMKWRGYNDDDEMCRTPEIFNGQGILDDACLQANLRYLPEDERHTGWHEELQPFKALLMASGVGNAAFWS